jgi:molybdate transport system regulatory protein
MKASGRIWLEMEDGIKLGHGKMQLLALAGKLGSLKKAAEQMNISYRQAWYKINQMNKMTNAPVLILSRGGKHGGSAHLSEYGKSLISHYEKLSKSFVEFLAKMND